jgi:hypothetical protein
MDKLTLRRIGWIGASLGLTSVLVGCQSLPSGADPSTPDVSGGSTTQSGYLDSENGLGSLNGLGSINGLNGTNGLNATNGLNSTNGLNATNGLNSTNGLGSINGLNSTNGFNGTNGFNSINGFNATNGLNSTNGLNIAGGLANSDGLGSNAGMMTNDAGRKVVQYMAKCALGPGDSLVKQDQNGANYTFAGGIGLAPQWKTAGCNQACSEQMSACLMAHINSSGVHIPLWMDSPMSSIGWGQSPWFPTREGTFFGQIMVTNSANNLDAYYCNGPSTDKNVVPGRLGSNQGSVPYADAWPTSAGFDGKCDNSLTAHSTGGCIDNAAGDGSSQCSLNGTTWNYPITVWRGQTFQAEDAQGGAWTNSGGACAANTSGCSWTPGGLGFNASQCSTPGSNGCAIILDSNNGMGKRIGYFNGSSKGLKFSGVNVACAGAANLTVYTTNGDAVNTYNRHFSFIVNGGAPQDVAFAGAADWSHPVGQAISLTGFNQGTNNTIYVTATGSNGAPDLDWIEITNTGGACGAAAGSSACAPGKTVALKNLASGLFASARNDTLNVIGNVANASTWEEFDIIDQGNGLVALKSHMNNLYVSADLGVSSDAPLRARSSAVGGWEQFTIQAVSGGYAFKANANGKFVQANLGLATDDLQARATTPNSWETFNCQ